jgi:SAM-dependent methyltransferase
MTIDEQKLQQFVGKMFTEISAGYSGPLALIGDKLGYYAALKEGPLTSAELAQRTGTNERYAREWLAAAAAAEWLQYDPAQKKFSISPEAAVVFTDENSPAYLVGGFYGTSAMYAAVDKLVDAFRTGKGVGWGEHHEHLFCGTAKLFRPSYRSALIQAWIPALQGNTEDKLKRGAKVADVGCGYGLSTVFMAQAFPRSHFYGFDTHAPSLEKARALAREEGVNNVTFEEATAKNYPGQGYDLVGFFDCLHDMGDPVGAAAHALTTLDSDGTVLIVEPFAQDQLEQNMTPVGRIYYAASTAFCTPGSLSQEVGLALGAQAGESRLREVITKAGFKHFRRASETAFNLVFEARR